MQQHKLKIANRRLAMRLCSLAALFILPLSILANEIALVVNSTVATPGLLPQEVRDVFLGNKRTWDDGSQIILATIKPGTEIHRSFTKTYMSMTEIQFDLQWKKRIFSGRGMEPKSFATEADLLKFVAATPGAVGYVSATTTTDKVAMSGCKVVSTGKEEGR